MNLIFITHYFTVSGAAGNQNPIIMPRSGTLVGLDIAAGAMCLEAAAGTSQVHALMFNGAAPQAISAPINDSEYEGCIGGVAGAFRLNAAAGEAISLNKFIPLQLPFKSSQTFQLAYRVVTNALFYGFFTFHIRLQ